jgi:NAD(P)-dependent dehydrogenase (short-subunit alcohol dehydrogenase family)
LVEQIRQQFGTPAMAVAGDISQEADVARMFDQIEQQLGRSMPWSTTPPTARRQLRSI